MPSTDNDAKVNILLVDDRPDALLTLEAVLQGPDYNLVKAHSGPEALALLEGTEYAVILLDVQMPHMNGFETANLIKKRPQSRDTPIIFVTAINKDTRYIQEGYQSGAVDYLFKPFDIAILRSKVAVFADLHRKTRKIQDQAEKLYLQEQELSQTRKLEAVGRLAGGVAHDFNNLVTGILGISEEIRNGLDPQDPRRADLEEVVKAAHRAFALTRQLLAFGRKQMTSPKVLDINEIITDLTAMLLRLVGEDLHLITELTPGLPRIKIDPSQLEQVLLNLVLNARDAMPQGGRITLITAQIKFDDSHPRFHSESRPGAYVSLKVSDTGCGMDADMMAQIFEPFFTTKDRDKGTGLGLATVYGIVKQNQGEIFVDSSLGQGSSFTILWPVATAEEPKLLESPPDHAVHASGKEMILVVEDESIVRHVVRNVLSRHGYDVLEASHPAEAVELCRREGNRIKLMITDVIMPGMNGRELAEALRPQFPNLPVLYISAYTEDIIAHRGILEPGIAFLDKSCIHSGLIRKVRELLDRATDLSDPSVPQPLQAAK